MGDGASELLTVLIDTYLEESPKILQRMGEAIAQEEPTAMGMAAHTLKSSSASLGAINLSKICQQLEHLGQSQSTIDASQIMSRIELEYDRVKMALKSERQQG